MSASSSKLFLVTTSLACIPNPAGEVLLVNRPRSANDTTLDHWTLPGGKSLAQETVRDCMHRCVLQQTGLEIVPLERILVGGLLGSFSLEVWLCSSNGNYDAHPTADDPLITDTQWANPRELPTVLASSRIAHAVSDALHHRAA